MNRKKIDGIFNIELISPASSGSQSNENLYYDGGPVQPINRQKSYEWSHRTLSDDMNSSRRRNSLNRLTNRIINGKETCRVKAINLMPSRMMHRSLSVDGHLLSTGSTDNEIDKLTQEIEQHDYLMEDNPFAEQLRMDTLKAMPQSLTVKRQVKFRLQRHVTSISKSHNISRWKRFKYSVGNSYNRFKQGFTSMLSNMELWYNSLKTIEGHFGSSVAAYFKFLRWLFLMNVVLLLLAFNFITVPQILLNNVEVVENRQQESSKRPVVNETITSSFRTTQRAEENHNFNVLDIFTAEGSLTNTALFYGAYSNITFSLTPPHEYSLPFAYFMTMMCLYIATFIYVSMRMARSYRKSFIESYGGGHNYYTHKIFCAWDFGISIEKAADLKHAAIYNELKEMLNELNQPKVKESKLKLFWDISSQITAHFLVLAMLAGLATAMWVLLIEFGETAESTPWTALYLSLAVNVTMMILNFIFEYISLMEEYKSPRTALHINLLRNFLLEIVIIGVLLVFWLTTSYTTTGCWETSIGQEIYRLVLIDFFVATIGSTLLQGIRVLLNKKWPQIGLPEFDISRGTLGLIFNQSLLWVGLLFSPLLAVIVAVKMLLTFYIKKLTLMYFCKSPTQVWRSAQTQTLYLVLIFFSLLLVIISHGYIITQVTVSKFCGPFRGKGIMFGILTDGILELKEEHLFWRIITVIAKPAVVGGILITMGVLVYYLRAKAKAQIAMVKLLKEMLSFEGQDKEFLLSNISKATQGKEWIFNEELVANAQNGGLRDRDHIMAESSSTWKYNQHKLYDQNQLRNRPSTSPNFNNEPQPSTSGNNGGSRLNSYNSGSDRSSLRY